ncbi:Serine/threonine protein kinase [Streptomyces sp. 2131.1]|uniref:serine/threonine-protein kinase n=1 Tax=Streptomyces sp. 2131.1 TaxID=1855346 RepID=UPI00089B55E1|nr:serine/threonine-protein kinase [Streptomyces sp. 2131.1]SED63366.1 Serine/threonine protein kinase [Streptomyces sp. 2131.1]
MRLRETAQTTASRLHAEVLSGRYRLDELLGSGGAADVYRGLDLRMRRPVAVKVFRPDACLDAEESWRSEAEILARLHHPGLVTAFDAGHHDGRAFLVMQLVEGTTLKSRIARGPLTPDATAALGAGLAQALAHAHEAGIVHRDVKPSNILLDAERRPYLVDFGISRPLDATTRTATDTLVGTAAYLSPEQVLGRPVGRPADIYALGLVLLECLTGRIEYGGGPVEAAIARLHRQPALPAEAPEPFRALLRRMTDQDDHARPTARDCARALTAPADTTPTVTAPATTERLAAVPEPPGAVDRAHAEPPRGRDDDAPGTPRRGRTVMAGGGAALAAVAAVVLAVTGSSAPPDTERTAPPASTAPAESTRAPDGGGERGATTAPPPAVRSSAPHDAAGTRRADAPSPGTSSASPGESAAGTGSKDATPTATPTPSTAPTTSNTPPSASITPSDGTTSAPATPSTTASESPWQPPGRAKETGTAKDRERGRAG